VQSVQEVCSIPEAHCCATHPLTSLVEEAREVRERIAARLRELEPLVAEYHELQKVAVEMGIDATDPPSAPAATAQAPRRQRPRSTRHPRRAKGAGKGVPSAAIASENDESAQRVREAVRDQPGKTVADYAGLLSLSPAPLYRPTRELTAAGVIVKRGRQLFPA
jgi:hypothetical protein